MATLVKTVAAPDTRAPAAGNVIRRILAALRENSHFLITGALAAGLVPALHACKLPLRFAWADLLQAWVGLMFQSIVLASLLYAISGPLKSTLGPVALRYWTDKRRLLLLAPFLGGLVWLLGFGAGLVLTVGVLATMELMDHGGRGEVTFSSSIAAVMLPAAYLFAGLVLVFAYNDVIVSVKFYGGYDAVFNHFDSMILGTTVPTLAHHVGRMLPLSAFKFMEFVYFGMFSQIGAGIILTALAIGRASALKLVGTLLTAYALALVCFYFWPSHGPYYICPVHFRDFPHQLRAYATQATLLGRAKSIWEGRGIPSIGTDYFIAFPCMHIAQPLIVMWFLRRSKRILAALALVNVVLVASILLLEWHYFADLIGGVTVAVLSVIIVDYASTQSASAGEFSGRNAVTINPVRTNLLCAQKDTPIEPPQAPGQRTSGPESTKPRIYR